MKKAREELKKRHVNKIIILKGKDSEEDILYLGKIVKKGERVGIDTFPLHYKEYLEIINKDIRDNKFPKGVKLENVKTPQNFRMFIYGVLGLSEEKIKKRELDYVKNRHNQFWRFLKKVFHSIVRI